MTEKAKPVKKCVPHSPCKEGNHTYIVTAWQIGNGKEKAIHMRCQHCLIPMDLQEIESKEWREDNV